ncbi:MAG: hypothetical protein KUG64_11250 [Cycloclasticus sp.]|nr:hypothetical protein [Cycloclasticus sp.]
MKEVAFLTVVYPGCEPFLSDFLLSIRNQTFKLFDLVVMNDGDVDISLIRACKEINLIEIPVFDKTPAQIREFGLQYLLTSSYSKVILGDSDDRFSNNRIEISLKYLLEYDVVVNDLSLVGGVDYFGEKNYLSCRFDNRVEIFIDDILEKNLFGLSNTAINFERVDSELMSIDKNLVAIDWYIFSRLLLSGLRACFTNEAVTYYRQHEKNTVGLSCLSASNMEKHFSVKRLHYQKLAMVDDRYINFYVAFSRLEDYFSDENARKAYLQIIESKKTIDHPLWWEQMQII